MVEEDVGLTEVAGVEEEEEEVGVDVLEEEKKDLKDKVPRLQA